MADKAQGEWFVASESFVTGEGIAYHKDITRVRRGDKVLKTAPHLFKPLDETHRFLEVEQTTAAPATAREEEPTGVQTATAAPGEKRPGGITTESLKGK